MFNPVKVNCFVQVKFSLILVLISDLGDAESARHMIYAQKLDKNDLHLESAHRSLGFDLSRQ